MRFDLIVIGGGLAGLVAANRAAELGRTVAVLERGSANHYLCNSRVATGMFNFAHSDPKDDPEHLIEAIAVDTEGYADILLARAMSGVAGRGIDWLLAEGAQFIHTDRLGRQSWVLAPGRSDKLGLDWQGRGPDEFVRRLGDNLRRRGGQLILSARATTLNMHNGVCCGVTADVNGTATAFESEAVVLADGGFQNNLDMVGRYISPKPDALVQRSAGTSFGDAIRMAEAIGAKLVDMDCFYGHLLSQIALRDSDYWPYPTLDTMTGASILIDRDGCRFADEGLSGITLANIIARLDDPLSTRIVFDATIWDTAGRAETRPPNPTLNDVEGALIKAETLNDLAVRSGIPAQQLTQTVACYNAAIRSGTGAQLEPTRTPGRRFGQRRDSKQRIEPMPIVRPPFYCAPIAVGISYTMGGIAIDEHARALSQNGNPIIGLYAVGSTAGGLEGGPIAGYIGGLSKAYCLGFIAGEHIAVA